RMLQRKNEEYARDHVYRLITTTLASSRWKSLEQIEAAGLDACADIPDVTYWTQNWRKGGLSERRAAIIREMNFYNQTYCGCEFSIRNSEL
ncbi:MAG: epoxyqueuosine reductase QueH, partial [Muribaculaceae bacterium]|nr:epoxyqueuosine reductase QueH [Muribaculaceae bacterium]